MNFNKLAEDIAAKVQKKLDTNTDDKPTLFSKQMLAETGVDALEIAIRKFLMSS